jgi:hypothetical protein
LDESENWVYCCHACNEFKGDYWQPRSSKRILHPLRDSLAAHLVEHEDGMLCGLSKTGTFHIEKLQLNRPQLVNHRRHRRLLEAARQAQVRAFESLKQLEEQLETLAAQVALLERGDLNV